MNYDELIKTFGQFGLAVLVGVLFGFERELRVGTCAAGGDRKPVLPWLGRCRTSRHRVE